jgi:hypothetical protein
VLAVSPLGEQIQTHAWMHKGACDAAEKIKGPHRWGYPTPAQINAMEGERIESLACAALVA